MRFYKIIDPHINKYELREFIENLIFQLKEKKMLQKYVSGGWHIIVYNTLKNVIDNFGSKYKENSRREQIII